MPLYNAEKYVAEAIESVLAQTYTNWELIIVNDGSTDNSLEVAKRYENEKIKVFSQVNSGAGAARNHGYSQSKGEFIKFFDADDILSNNILEQQVNLLSKNPNCITSTQWGRFYNDDISTFKLSPEECWKDMNSIDWICITWRQAQPMYQPAIFLIPKTLIQKAGLWDERLSLIDDFEFFTRVILSSKKIIHSEKSILYYRSGLPNALSGQKSRKAVKSAVLSAQLATNNLLEVLNNQETKRISANCLMTIVYEHKVFYPDLILPLENKIKELGGSDLKIKKGKVFNFVQSILGWYNTSLLLKLLKYK